MSLGSIQTLIGRLWGVRSNVQLPAIAPWSKTTSSSMAVFTIMVTAASGPNVPQAIRYLKLSTRHELRVIAVDMSLTGAAGHFADAFLQVPTGIDPGYV